MIELQLFDRAQVALRHCAHMESGDQVLIVSDGTLSPRILPLSRPQPMPMERDPVW